MISKLPGNLSRCTGYAPTYSGLQIAVEGANIPDWICEGLTVIKGLADLSSAQRPTSIEQLAAWYLKNPDATLIGGATDVGLWLTIRLKGLPKLAFLNGINALKQINVNDAEIRIGAGVSITELELLMQDHHASFAAMLRRYSSTQIRNAATIGRQYCQRVTHR